MFPAGVAQLVEQLICRQQVASSSLAASSNNFKVVILLADHNEIYSMLREAKPSEALSAILNFFDDEQVVYHANNEEASRQDLLSTDRTHQLELNDMSDEELLEWSKTYRNELRERRTIKDDIIAKEPLVLFLESDQWQGIRNGFRRVLGDLRRTEQRMQTRVYHFRVLNESDLYVQPKPSDEPLDPEEADDVWPDIPV